jgi:multiple sugar transport system permease protein
MGKAAWRRDIGGTALSLVMWAFIGIGMLFPFYWAVVTSFKAPQDLSTDPPLFWPQNFAIATNYSYVFQQLNMGQLFLNSFYVATVSTAVVLFTSSLGGYVFEKIRLRGKEILFLVILATIMVPFPVRMIPLYLIFRDLGLINTLEALFVGSLVSAYGIFLMRQFIKTVPSELLDAARIDGCNEFYIYLRIALPLCKAALAALGIFHFIHEWDSFLWPLLMINDKSLHTLPLGLASFRNLFNVQQWNVISAGAMTAMVPVVVVYLMAQRHFVRGIALSGIKG